MNLKITGVGCRRSLMKVAAALVILLVLASTVQAIIGWALAAVIGHLLADLVKAIIEWAYRTTDLLLNLVGIFIQINPCVWSSTGTCDYNTLNIGVSSINISLPVDANLRSIHTQLMRLLTQFYMAAILILGAYIIFMSGSPTGRVLAKDLFIRMFIGMIIVGQSPLILQGIFDIAKDLTSILMSTPAATPSGGSVARMLTFFKEPRYCCTMYILMFIMLVAGLISAFRYFLMYVLAAFFPLILFLYFTDVPNPLFSFRGIGTRLFKFTILLVMIQLLQAMFLVIGILISEAAITASMSWQERFIQFLLMIGAYTGILFTPMIGMQLMQWVGAVVHVSAARPATPMTRFVATWMRTGKVSTALSTASGQYMVGHNMGDNAGGEGKSPYGGGFMAAVPNPGFFGGTQADFGASHSGPTGPSGSMHSQSAMTSTMGSSGDSGSAGVSMAAASGISSAGDWGIQASSSGPIFSSPGRSSAGASLGGAHSQQVLSSSSSSTASQPSYQSMGGGSRGAAIMAAAATRVENQTQDSGGGGSGSKTDVEYGKVTPMVSSSNETITEGEGLRDIEQASSQVGAGSVGSGSMGSKPMQGGGSAKSQPGMRGIKTQQDATPNLPKEPGATGEQGGLSVRDDGVEGAASSPIHAETPGAEKVTPGKQATQGSPGSTSEKMAQAPSAGATARGSIGKSMAGASPEGGKAGSGGGQPQEVRQYTDPSYAGGAATAGLGGDARLKRSQALKDAQDKMGAQVKEKTMMSQADRQQQQMRLLAEREWEQLRLQANFEDEEATRMWVMQVMRANKAEAEKMMAQMNAPEVQAMASEATTRGQFQSFMKDEGEMSRMRGAGGVVGSEARDVDNVMKSGIFEKPYTLRNHMFKNLSGAGDHQKLDKMSSAINIGMQAGAPTQDEYVLNQFDKMMGLEPEKRQRPSSLTGDEQSYLDDLNTGGKVNMRGSEAVDSFKDRFNVDNIAAQRKLGFWREHTDTLSDGKKDDDEKKHKEN